MAEKTVNVRLTANTQQYQASMKAAGVSTGTVTKATDTATTQVGSKWQRAGAGISSAMSSAHLLAAGAIAGMAMKSVDAASNLEESINAVKVSYGDAGDAVLKLGEKSVESFGLSQRAFNEAAVSFTSFAEDVAGPGGDVAATLEDLMLRSTDFASVMNIDVTQAAGAFKSALAGEAEPMKAFGVNISDAAIKAYALETGLYGAGGAMTDTEKVQARYALLMKETEKVTGDFANTSDGYANSMKRAKGELENLMASIGRVMLPVLADGLQALEDLMGAWKALENSKPIQLALEITGTEDTGLLGLGKWALDESNFMAKGVGRITGALDTLNSVSWTTTGTLGDLSGATGKAGDSMDEAGGSADDLADSTDDVKVATYDARKAIDEATEAWREQKEATDRARESNMKVADSTYDLWDAEADLADAITDATATLEDKESTLYDVRGAMADVARAADDVVTKEMELNGTTRDSAEGQRIWTEKMLETAATLSGPMQTEVLAHIGRVNGIPESKLTEILMDTNPDDYAQVTAELDNLTRPRTTTIQVNMRSIKVGDGWRFINTSGTYNTNAPIARAGGGPVRAGHLYEVGEGDAAEMLMMGGRQYMIPGNNGNVIGGGQMERFAPSGSSSATANTGRGGDLIINHNGPNLSAADVSRGYTMARLAQV